MNSLHKIALAFVPHPDDLEILLGPGIWHLIHHGFQVYEILMTGGEYGIINRFKKSGNTLKGNTLRCIRERENRRAKLAYGAFSDGKPHVQTIPMNYIDGFVPFNQNSVIRIQEIIKKLQPTIVIGPDPVYSIDWHKDHMATAQNTYFAIKKLPQSLRPKFFFLFQTFRPDFFLSIVPETWAGLKQNLLAHSSQIDPLNVKLMLALFKHIVTPLRRNRFGLRQIDIKNFYRPPLTLRERMWLSRFQHIKPDKETYIPLPDQLGLCIEPN